MNRIQKFFITLLSILFTTAASASVTFPISGWDGYDGSERLGLFQEQCGDGWPTGLTANEAKPLLAKLSRVQAGQILVSCDPKQLKAPSAPALETELPVAESKTAAPPVVASTDAPAPLEGSMRIEHPFKTVAKSKQYPCWIDANGRHRVEADDPKRMGLCWGKTAEEKGL